VTGKGKNRGEKKEVGKRGEIGCKTIARLGPMNKQLEVHN
jgi:hypothetical protein